MKNILILGSAVALLACVDTGKETGEDSATPAPVEYVPPTPTVTWGETSVSLSIANPEEGAAYTLGIAEVTGGCEETSACWTGEDCHRGYALSDGGNLLYCHPVTGASLELAYGAATDAVSEGSTTVFGDASFSANVTYIMDNTVSPEDGSCWIWGADNTYYANYGKACTEM